MIKYERINGKITMKFGDTRIRLISPSTDRWTTPEYEKKIDNGTLDISEYVSLDIPIHSHNVNERRMFLLDNGGIYSNPVNRTNWRLIKFDNIEDKKTIIDLMQTPIPGFNEHYAKNYTEFMINDLGHIWVKTCGAIELIDLDKKKRIHQWSLD